MIGQLSVEHPKLPILTISHDHQALLQSLQKGAKYFLTHPVGAGRPARRPAAGARRARQRHRDRRRRDDGPPDRLVVDRSPCSAPAAGSAPRPWRSTSAATLAADPNNAVALIDLDLALGDADIALEVSGIENITIADLARNIERLDMNFLRRALAKHEPTGLSILRHPLEIADVGVHPRGPRRAHPEPAEDQLHAPGARPEQVAAADRPDGPADGRPDPAGRPAGAGEPAERGAADPLPGRRGGPGRQGPGGDQPAGRTRSRTGSA